MMYGTSPSTVPTSITSMTFGWWMAAAARASLMKRATRLGLSRYWRFNSLTATLRRSTGCSAR